MLGIPRVGDRSEGFLLFTSGSSGTPKGVALTHRNLLGNVRQFAEMLNLDRTDAVLGSLPFFHSFGATVTILFPMIHGVRLITYPNPLDVVKQAALIARLHQVGQVVERRYNAKTARFKARIPPHHHAEFARFIVSAD